MKINKDPNIGDPTTPEDIVLATSVNVVLDRVIDTNRGLFVSDTLMPDEAESRIPDDQEARVVILLAVRTTREGAQKLIDVADSIMGDDTTLTRNTKLERAMPGERDKTIN